MCPHISLLALNAGHSGAKGRRCPALPGPHRAAPRGDQSHVSAYWTSGGQTGLASYYELLVFHPFSPKGFFIVRRECKINIGFLQGRCFFTRPPHIPPGKRKGKATHNSFTLGLLFGAMARKAPPRRAHDPPRRAHHPFLRPRWGAAAHGALAAGGWVRGLPPSCAVCPEAGDPPRQAGGLCHCHAVGLGSGIRAADSWTLGRARALPRTGRGAQGAGPRAAPSLGAGATAPRPVARGRAERAGRGGGRRGPRRLAPTPRRLRDAPIFGW